MDRVELRDCLVNRFNIDELKDICFEMGIKDQLFPSETIGAFARELVIYCERNGLFELLVEKCSPRSNYKITTSSEKLRDYDYKIVSDCHATLSNMRNLIKGTLGIPYIESGINEKIAQLSNQSLENTPILQRVMGSEWGKELTNAVVQAVLLVQRMSGRDYHAEAKALESRSVAEAKAFFGEFQEKTEIINILDKLVLDLETRLK